MFINFYQKLDNVHFLKIYSRRHFINSFDISEVLGFNCIVVMLFRLDGLPVLQNDSKNMDEG